MDIKDLAVGQCVEVATKNTLYVIEKLAGGNRVRVTGGSYFPEPTETVFVGSTLNRYFLKEGVIEVGMNLEFHHPNKPHKSVITTKVQEIQ